VEAVSSGKPLRRILLIAEAANPAWTSVPLVGWSIYRALSKIASVHLVTHVRNRDAITDQGLVEGRDFTVVDNEKIAAPLYRLATILRGGTGKGWTTVTALSSLAYYSFESALWRQFERRLEAGEFDVVHRVTPLSPTSQSIIAKKLRKLKIPFVVGPLNGGVPWPSNFLGRQHAEHEWLSHVRFVYKLMPGYWSMRRYSAAILVGSKFTLSDLPRSVRTKCVYVPENGVSIDEVLHASIRTPSQVLRVAFVGRLVPYKGADMLLEAAAGYLESGRLQLLIIGDGPERSAIEALARKISCVDAVRFHGMISRADVLMHLRNCDVMILPSIREFGGGVVIEAMAVGATVIVADYGGPSELVDPETGIKVAFHDRESLVTGLKKAFDRLLAHPEEIEKFGRAARKKVLEKYTWEAKAVQICAVYEAVLAGKENLASLSVP
jgi:glycosyltransferase involved in cell wall biosynthesis